MTTPTREQVVQWAKQAWDDTGEGWTDSRWFDERAPSFEAFATLARADLEAELESLRKDAERYRWLRENDWFKHSIVVLAPYERTAHETDVYLDSAIDAAIAAEPKEK